MLDKYIQALNNTLDELKLKDCSIYEHDTEKVIVVERDINQIKISLDQPLINIIAGIARAFAIVVY